MILVWGSRADPPIERVSDALATRGAEFISIEPRQMRDLRYELEFGASPSGWLEVAGRRVDVEQIKSVYLRPEDGDSSPSQHASIALMALVASLRGLVVNRPAAGRANASKPYQLTEIAAAGFDVPDTLVTTDPDVAKAFLAEHGRLVYKSVSGIRSIVATLEPGDEQRLDGVRTGPVQLQAYVPGLDVRVHVVGERWFACSVRSDAADYRYASASGGETTLAEYQLPEDVGLRIASMVRDMGLAVAGVDLRLRPDGSWVCFEVNPSPAFTWYEEATGHPIAETIAELLDNGVGAG